MEEGDLEDETIRAGFVMVENVNAEQSVAAIEAEARQQAAVAPLDAEALKEAAMRVEAGYILKPDRTTHSYWQKVAAAYAAVAEGEQTPSDAIRGAGGGQTAPFDPDLGTK